jgi:chromosome segregation ATPase
MDTSRSSSVSSQHYSTLLNTVSELRTELEKTLGKTNILESNNQTLSNNYQTIKDELIETRKKYNTLCETYTVTVQEKFEAEQRFEDGINNIRNQLAAKTTEFEIVRDKLVPQDIDQLRIKVQEELEIKHKQQLQSVEHQLSKQVDEYYMVKHEIGRCKAESEIVTQHLQHEIVALRKEKSDIESSLRAEILRLKDIEYANSAQESGTIARSKELELSFSLENLRLEFEAVRNQRDAMAQALQKTQSECEEVNMGLRTQLSLLSAEKHGLQERLSKCLLDLDNRDTAIAGFRRGSEDSESKLARAARDLQASEKRSEAQRNEYNLQLEQLSDSHETERHELQDALDAANERLGQRESQLRISQREATEMQLRAEGNEAELRRAHQTQLQEFRRRLAVLELQLAEATHTIKTNECHNSTNLDQAVLERDGAKSELSRVTREKDVLLTRLRELEGLVVAEKQRLSTLQSESATKQASLEKKVHETLSASKALENQLVETRGQLSDTQGRISAARVVNEQLERKCAQQTEQAEAMRRELEKLTPAFRDQFESMRGSLKDALAKEKRRADAYKTKALEAHERAKAAAAIHASMA